MEIGNYIIEEKLSLKGNYNLQEMNIPIELIGLSDRVINSLKTAGIDNYSKLINVPIRDLITIRSFGANALKEIIDILENKDLKALDINNSSSSGEKGYLSRYDYIIRLSIKNDKEKEILKLRNQGVTLEEIGQSNKLTRERVRQLESRATKKIVEAINNDDKLIEYLDSISDKGFIKADKIEEIMQSENDYIFIYCLKNKNVKGTYYIEEYDGFLINGNEKILESIKEQLPLIVSKDKLEEEIDKIVKETNISRTLVYEIITKSYIIYKNYYGKYSLDVSEMSAYIINEKFSGKIKITNKEKLLELAYLMDEYFGTEYQKTPRNLQARVMDTYVLIERGTYVPVSDNYTIDKKVLKKIDKYINDYKRNALPLEALYNTFKHDLIQTNVTNRYIFQSVLKKAIGDKYKTSRDYIYKNERYDYAEEVIKFIKDSKTPVSFKDLLKEFDEVKPHTVMRCLLADKIIYIDGGYICADNIDIKPNELRVLKNDLQLLLSDNETHVSKNVYDNIGIESKNILNQICFDAPDKMYFLLKAYFFNDFSFSRPYIANKNINIERGYDKLVKEIINRKETYVKEFAGLKEKYNVVINRFLEFIDENMDSFILVSKDRIETLTNINLDENQFSNLDDILDEFMNGENVKSAYSFKDFNELPEIGLAWNPWLLYSIIKMYSEQYDVSTTSNHFRDAVPLIVRKNYDINEDDKKAFANDKYYISDDIEEWEDLFDEQI